MLTSRRQPIERPPSRIAGAVYIVIGFFALLVAVFFYFYQGDLGALTHIRVGFSLVIALYGLFRIYTGISMIRRANKMSRSVIVEGKDNSQSNTTSV